jgi:hypothetical protein
VRLTQDWGRGAAGVLEDSLPTQLDHCNNAQPPLGGSAAAPQPSGNAERTTPGQHRPQPERPGSGQEAKQLAPPFAQPDQSRWTREGCPHHGPAIPDLDGGGPSHGHETPAQVAVWPEVENRRCRGDQRGSSAQGFAAGSEGAGRVGLQPYTASSNSVAAQSARCPPTDCVANNGTPEQGTGLPGSGQAHDGSAQPASAWLGAGAQGVSHRSVGFTVPGGFESNNEGTCPVPARTEAGLGLSAVACGGAPPANLDQGAAETPRGVKGAREAFIDFFVEVDIRVFSGIATSKPMWSHLEQVSLHKPAGHVTTQNPLRLAVYLRHEKIAIGIMT